MTDLRSRITAELDALIAIRHDLHAHPELSYEEHRTSEVVQRELGRLGVEFRAGLAGGTGVVGHIPGGAGAPIALRADMDALPIQEQTGLPWASTTPGKMHACGHDGHTTILLGTARVLAQLAAEGALPRPVTLIFQPAEEGGAGGEKMVQEGCLDGTVLGPPVTRIYGLHGWPGLRQGVISSRPGPLLASADMFEIVVRGHGGHAAMPHLTRDPVLTAAHVIIALQQIASRNVDPLDAVVVSVTRMQGSDADNIIPTSASLHGTFRTLREETRTLVRRRMEEIVEHTARAGGCTGEIVWSQASYPVTFNHEAPLEDVKAVAERLGPDRWTLMENPVMGGEDFAFYGRVVPACFFVVGLRPPGQEAMPGLHHPTFDFQDGAIATGVEMFCRLVLEGG